MSARPSPSLSEPSAHAAGGGGSGGSGVGVGSTGGGAGQVLRVMITPLQQTRNDAVPASASVIRSPARFVAYIKPLFFGSEQNGRSVLPKHGTGP